MEQAVIEADYLVRLEATIGRRMDIVLLLIVIEMDHNPVRLICKDSVSNSGVASFCFVFKRGVPPCVRRRGQVLSFVV
jgi:hypothetical protein